MVLFRGVKATRGAYVFISVELRARERTVLFRVSLVELT
jgi:hypothetical protein